MARIYTEHAAKGIWQRIKRIKRIHLLRNYRIKRMPTRCIPLKAPKIRLIRLICC